VKRKTPRVELTPRQHELLDFIRDSVRNEQRIPSYREMAQALGVSAVGTIQDHVSALIENGYIEKKDRHLRLIDEEPATPSLSVPILGEVAAGSLQEAIEDPQGHLPLSPEMLGLKVRPDDLFALKVRGESMIEVGIHPGDWIVVHRQEKVRSGDIVVVDWEGEATVKEIEFPKSKSDPIRLIPKNSKMRPIEIPADERLRVLGKVVFLQRSFA
jgi:repressor LexA